MPSILERLRGILHRAERPEPIADQVRRVLVEGKREQLLSGLDAADDPFARLKPSTLARRDGDGPPLVPHRAGSRMVTGYVVEVRVEAGRLAIEAGWPGVPFVRYHQSGTPRMAQRDPGGFRAEDRAEAMRIYRAHVIGTGETTARPGWGARFRGWIGR